MSEILIIGAGSVGGHIAINFSQYFSGKAILGFLDDNPAKIGYDFCGYKVLGPIDDIIRFPKNTQIVIGIAFPKIKNILINKIKSSGYREFPTLISQRSWISHSVSIGEGSIIFPGTSINYKTRIGDFSVLNMNCAIGHDCKIGDLVSFAPSVSLGGHTKIGSLSELGIGCNTIQSVNIGKSTTIGAGTVIIRDVPDYAVVVGNPGRIIGSTQ